MTDEQSHDLAALQDFRRARSRAALAGIVARLTGRSDDLLSYDDVRQKLHARVGTRRELRDIPLDAIVGSVGRYGDFNRQFLPRRANDAERWARVKAATNRLAGLPPIEVYQVGDAYFVLDGNHRVSVAREAGASHIQAYVTEVNTRVPLSPNDSPDDLIRKGEYADFLDLTRLDETRPGADLSVTAPGQYRPLEDAIQAHRLRLSNEQGRDVAIEAAAADWYDHDYLPAVQIIHDQNLLKDFPDRTATDLYTWLMRHRAELKQDLGWEIDNNEAARDLADRFSRRPERLAARVGDMLRDSVTPSALDTGPEPGTWRRGRTMATQGERLFEKLLVAISGAETGWFALDQALEIARREGGRLNGLHVVATEAQRASPEAQAVRQEFDRRCTAAGVLGSLAIETGGVVDTIRTRAPWADLVAVSLSYPPGAAPLDRLRSGFRSLVHRCPKPLLAVPRVAPQIERALLAYDGSPKSEEALFVATYLAWRWKLRLTVLTVFDEGRTSAEMQAHPQRYLERHLVRAAYVTAHGSPGTSIVQTARELSSDLVLIGGYRSRPLIGAMLGSTLDAVLREAPCPVLICR